MARYLELINIEYEVQIGELLAICTGEVRFDFNSWAGNNTQPPEETLEILTATFKDATYYIDGDDVGIIAAKNYYKDYVVVNYNEMMPDKLQEYLQTHCKYEAESKANKWIDEQD